MLNRSFQRLSARLFRDRELLIRSDDRIVALRLTALRQKVAAAAIAGLTGLWLFAGSGLVWQHAAMDAREGQIAALQAEKQALRARLDRLADVGDKLTRDVPQAAPPGVIADLNAAGAAQTPLGKTASVDAIQADLAHLASRREVLAHRLSQTETRRRELAAELRTLRRNHADLDRELRETRQTLADVSSGKDTLGSRLAEALADLHAVRVKRRGEMQRRLRAEEKLAALQETATRLRKDELTAKRQQQRLRADFAEMRTVRDRLLRERKKLASRVGRLETALGQVAGQGTTDLIARIGNLEDSLVAAEQHSDSVAAERAALQNQVARLEAHTATIRERHSALFSHYTRQARASLDAIEKTVAMTGLDVDHLVERVAQRPDSLGGPFVPFADLPAGVVAEARELDRQMQRLKTLQVVLASLPLTAPVDNYWVSSTFGKRRDPYNGRWAMHEGLDLAGQAGLTVMASAPGKVVYAGYRGGYGKLVEIDHGFGITTRYGHLRSIAVDKGDRVAHRGAVGELGNTGRSTGPHIHYEIRVDGKPVDPMNFLKAGKHVFKG